MFHIVVHIMLLLYVVPLFGAMCDDKQADDTYKDMAQHVAATFFSTNPIHCLRSRFIHEHNPPCNHWVPGKDHLMQQNEDIGSYFGHKIRDGLPGIRHPSV